MIGSVRQYGPDAVEAACAKAMDVDVVAVPKIDSMLAKATENTDPIGPKSGRHKDGRYGNSRLGVGV